MKHHTSLKKNDFHLDHFH